MGNGGGPILLEVDNLTVGFDRRGGLVRAVDQVSFAVNQGETVALVGESGCGKSMTALSLMGLVQPPGRIVSGSVTFEGRNLLALPERDLQRVRGARMSLVFQEPASALNPVFTVGDQVAEALIVHRLARKRDAAARAVDMLEAVRIPDATRIARAYPHQLSGGMRQRVMIAIALVCRPALVIADEPTSSLDVTIQAEILELLADLKTRYDLSLLLITHDLDIVAGIADRVLVMYAGRIVEQATAATLFAAAAHPYTKALLRSRHARRDGRRLPTIEGSVPDIGALPAGCTFAPRCPERIERCDVAAPEPSAVAPDQSVRCHRSTGSGSQ